MWQRTVPLLVSRVMGDTSLPLCIQVREAPPVCLSSPAQVTLRINSFQGYLSLLFPSMGRFAENYVRGHIDLEGELEQIMQIGEELGHLDTLFSRLQTLLPRPRHKPGPSGADQIRHHYDASNEFYALWLDSGMVYSGAYFRSDNDSLEQAQQQKLEHICRKLRLKPGDQLLDIGCGWGALMFRAVEQHGVTATGITLSQAQFDYVEAQIRQRGLQNRCRVELCDYRDLDADLRFNRITSIGMIEHVGEASLPGYFRQIEGLLEPGGLVLIQGITLGNLHLSPHASGLSDFMEQYVFPGSQLAPVSHITEQMNAAELECLDLESLRLHYARTLTHWGQRLEAHRQQAIAEVGEEKFRIWRIYMGGCAYAFDRGWISLYQWLGGKRDSHHHVDAPLTRDDIYQPG